jgi:hypothetical protein
VPDDTWPGGPRQVTRTFKAPFARASREDDYRTAWGFLPKTHDAPSGLCSVISPFIKI